LQTIRKTASFRSTQHPWLGMSAAPARPHPIASRTPMLAFAPRVPNNILQKRGSPPQPMARTCGTVSCGFSCKCRSFAGRRINMSCPYPAATRGASCRHSMPLRHAVEPSRPCARPFGTGAGAGSDRTALLGRRHLLHNVKQREPIDRSPEHIRNLQARQQALLTSTARPRCPIADEASVRQSTEFRVRTR
jgi:hypothetical protein